MVVDKIPQTAMAILIGRAVPSENTASSAETIAAIEFWMKPCKEEAAPAFLGNGVRAADVVWGNRNANPIIKSTMGPMIVAAWWISAMANPAIRIPASAAAQEPI